MHVEEVLTSTREGRQEMTEHERCHQLRQNFSADKVTNLAKSTNVVKTCARGFADVMFHGISLSKNTPR